MIHRHWKVEDRWLAGWLPSPPPPRLEQPGALPSILGERAPARDIPPGALSTSEPSAWGVMWFPLPFIGDSAIHLVFLRPQPLGMSKAATVR